MAFTSIKTLKDLEKAVAPAGGKGKRPNRFFTVQAGQSFRIRFRQELTEDSKNYDEKVGAAITVPVVVSPINWKWKCLSTASMEEYNYRCWATEQSANDKAWRPRPHLLINIAVEEELGIWAPRVLDTTFNQRHVGLTLIEYAKEFGTITDRYYKYSRTGSAQHDTNYSIIPLDVSPEAKAITDLEMHQLDNVYMKLPYEKQQVFLTTGELKDTW
jgi:hypothetical protein